MRVTALAENTALSDRFGKEHGLSFYIEANGEKILFDMGQTNLFSENASKLKLSISDVDLAVLSHGHYDHGGGLPFFIEQNEKADIWVHRLAFLPHYSQKGNDFSYIGLDESLKSNSRIRISDEVTEISENMILFSGVTERKCFSKSNLALFTLENGQYVNDTFAHEQNLIITEGDITVLFAGCAHNGILNIMEKAVKIIGKAPDYVFSGFHLSNPSKKTYELDDLILAISKELKEYPTKYFTGHCTGSYPFELLSKELGGQMDVISTGKQWKLEYPFLNPTKKLYYDNTYQTEFNARILYSNIKDDNTCVILDETCFYPEGGGQPWDTGFMNEYEVIEVHEKDDLIVHTLKGRCDFDKKNLMVHGIVNWERRHDLMQQHSGEHMISGLIHQKYGYENVGFHLGKDRVTIDFNGMIPDEDLKVLEEQVNNIIWKNSETEIINYSEEQAKEVEYRSKKELHGTIRVVTFPEADTCACCGLHVDRSGEVGLVKIINSEKIRGGSRLDIVCGKRALEILSNSFESNHQVSVLLSAKLENTVEAVNRMQNELLLMKQNYVELQNKWFDMIASNMEKDQGILHFENGLEPDAIRRLTVLLMESSNHRIAVFSGNDEDGYKYAIGKNEGDLRALVKKMNQMLNGRGGGKPFFVQGSVKSTKNKIQEFFQNEEI